MMACRQHECLAHDYELSLNSAQLETAYERSLAQLDALLVREDSRKSRVAHLVLDFDHELLQSKYERSEYDIAQLLQAEMSLKQQLLSAQEELTQMQMSTLTESRVFQEMKSDLTSMKRKVADYEKISAEKISLSKEIARMKEELGHLQSQNLSHQSLLAAKSALERQLNSLEVQLVEERRAFERRKNVEEKNENTEIRQQLTKLQDSLNKEADERRRMEQEMSERSAAWEQQRKSLEERLEKLRKQLRTAKEKLKQYQEYENDSLLSAAPQMTERSRQSVVSDRCVSMGHSGSSFNPSMTIATPGAVQVKTKFQRPSAVVGEKSTFSITPFLQRSRNVDDSSNNSDEDQRLQAESNTARKRLKASPKGDKTRRSAENEQYDPDDGGDNDENDVDQQPARAGTEKPRGHNPISLQSNEELPSMLGGASDRSLLMEGKQQPRKRKILGGQRDMTLLDEEEEDVFEKPKRADKPIPSLKLNSKRPQALGLTRLAFGETTSFSPLKRDKRLV